MSWYGGRSGFASGVDRDSGRRLGSWVLCLLLVAVAVGFHWSLASVASAGHCSGDKDHLSDGSCGYFTEQHLSPAATPTPSPTHSVKVENRPDVHIEQFGGDAPLRVTVTNQSPTTTATAWSEDDSANLAKVATFSERGFYVLLLSLGLVLFSLAGLLVFALPKIR